MCLGNFRELKIGFVGRNRSSYDSEGARPSTWRRPKPEKQSSAQH